MLTRLIFRKPFQVGRAAIASAPSLVASAFRRKIPKPISWFPPSGGRSLHECCYSPVASSQIIGPSCAFRTPSHVCTKLPGGASGKADDNVGVSRMLWRDDPATVRPMLATLADAPLTQPGLVYEPKYDGIRALIHVAPASPRAEIRIWS